MRLSLITTFVLLSGAFNLHVQYTNADSLVALPGFEKPLTLAELDSLMQNNAPETELFSGQPIGPGRLLRQFSAPCKGKVISPFGPRSGGMHSGTDIKMNRNDTVFSVFHGKVTRARYYYGYGNQVVINHGDNLKTSYAHLSSFLVKPGEMVKKGQPVGLAGNTGRATTNHLHFEIREGNKPFDAGLVFDFENEKLRDEIQHVDHLAHLMQGQPSSVYTDKTTVPQYYTVKKGDSLWKISRRFKTSVRALCQLNNLNENSVLSVGMVLKLN